MATTSSGQSRKKLLHPLDLLIAALLLLFCGWLMYLTSTFEEVSDLFAQDIQPSFFPRLLLWLIIMLTLLLPVEHRLFGNGEQLDKGRRRPVSGMTYLTVGLLFGLVLVKPWIGTYITLVAVCILLPLLWGERRWRIIIPYAIVFPALIAFLFTQVLKVYFEPGLLGLGFR